MSEAARVPIQSRILPELHQALLAKCDELGLNKSQGIEVAIAQWVEQPQAVPLVYEVADLQRRVTELEILVRSPPKKNPKPS